MHLTIVNDDERVIQVEIEANESVENLKALIEVKLGIPLAAQTLRYNGQIIRNDTILSTAGVENHDLLQVSRTAPTPAQSMPLPSIAPPPTPASIVHDHMTLRDIPGNCSPELLLEIMEKNPVLLPQLEHGNADLFTALTSKDVSQVRMVLLRQQMAAASRKYQEEKEIMELDRNPFDLEAQKKIEERIRLGNVQQNHELAMEEMPEAFGRVYMLYVPCVVNSIPVKAFVDSGAQSTIMSSNCAERCGIMRLVDTRYAGQAVGVGTARIIGRVHMASLKVGSTFFNCSFTILDQQDVDFLFGLDMLKRHQCSIDLKENVLSLHGPSGVEKVPFLSEHEIPASKHDQRTSNTDDAKPAAAASVEAEQDTIKIDQLVSLGFNRTQAIQALASVNGDADAAAALLFAQINA